MQPRWILPVSTLCAGIAFGFIAGKGAVDPAKVSGENSAPARARSSKLDRLSQESTNAVRGLLSGGSAAGGISSRGYSSLSSAQVAREVARLEHLPVGERAVETLLLFSRWGEVDPLTAMAQAAGYGVAGEAARCEALKSWSGNDPRAAADWFAKHSTEFSASRQGRSVSEQEIASSVIARAWASHDPESAVAWAASQGDCSARAVSSALGEIALENPALAIRLVESADVSSLKLSYSEIAWHWASRDFSAAEKWIRTLPAEQRDAAIAKAIASLALSEPMEAARQLDSMPECPDRDRSVAAVMRQLAKEDAGTAERWLDSQPNETSRRAGAISLISVMAVENPEGARGLLDSLQPGPVRDGAAAAFIRSSPSGKPEDLLELAVGLSNDADRGQSIANVISRWKEYDNEAAERYIMDHFSGAGSDH